MKIVEMNNCIEKMREIYKFDDEKTEIDFRRLDTSIGNGVVEVKTVDKNGVQITMAGKIDKIAKTGIDWTDFYNLDDDE